MYEVADRFYMSFVPEVREIVRKAEESGKKEQAAKISALLDAILSRPEHAWFLSPDTPKEKAR